MTSFADEFTKISSSDALGFIPVLIEKMGADLTEEARDKIAPKNFALTPKQSDTGEPAYPIHDKSHAANALARVKQHGTPKQRSEVYKDVAKKFPDLASRSDVPDVREKAASVGEILVQLMKLAAPPKKDKEKDSNMGMLGSTGGGNLPGMIGGPQGGSGMKASMTSAGGMSGGM